MQKETEGKGTERVWGMEEGRNGRLRKIKLLPRSGTPYVLNLAPKHTRNVLMFSIKASRDSKDLIITFGGKQSSEEYGSEGLTGKTEEGRPTQHYLTGFGIYDAEKEFEFETSVKGKKIMLRRSNDGDLTVWLKGEDLSKAEKRATPDKKLDYITTYSSGERVIGYKIEDFVHACNSYFYTILFGLEFK